MKTDRWVCALTLSEDAEVTPHSPIGKSLIQRLQGIDMIGCFIQQLQGCDMIGCFIQRLQGCDMIGCSIQRMQGCDMIGSATAECGDWSTLGFMARSG